MKRLLLLCALAFLPHVTASATDPEPTLGKKGALLLEETFDGDALPKGWLGKTGGLSVSGGTLHASQSREAGRLGLFSRELPMQDAAIRIDFKFSGRGESMSVAIHRRAS